MMSPDEARAAMLTRISALPSESIKLADARGRVLAAAVTATRDQPPFAASAMDGYALRAGDAPGKLKIVGEAAAGHAFTRTLVAGEAVRISTGAPVPEGADAILIQEDATLDGQILTTPEVKPGRHIRPRGGDFRAGAALLAQGRRLDATAVALAAAAGRATLDVAKRPRVTILCGGDEIVPPGAAPRADQIFESCSFGIAALAEGWGAMVTRCAPLADDAAAMTRAADQALSGADLVVCIGAASVGPHDHARAAFAAHGAVLHVEKIAVRPGKPTWFATTPRAAILGLPGNPASAFVCAGLFLRPLLMAFQGGDSSLAFKRAVLAKALPANGPREHYLRARVDSDENGHMRIDAYSDQDSSLHGVFARANALLRRLPNAPAAQAGALVDYLAWLD